METSNFENSVPRTISLCFIIWALNFGSSHNLQGQQAPPSIPTSEATIKAGESFDVDAQLLIPATQILDANVSYSIPGAAGAASFNCYGRVAPNQQKFKLTCTTNRNNRGGDYHVSGPFALTRPETSERKEYTDVRLPIVTIVANPYDETQFPTIVSTSLNLTTRQALSDGAVRAQDILRSLSAHFPVNTRDSKANRAYLVEQVENTKRVVDLTRRRYVAGENPNVKTPIFFDDFDRRLDKVIRDLGGTPSRTSTQLSAAPHLVFAQMPKTSDSVTVTSQNRMLNKHVDEFVAVLTDLVKGWFGMSGDTGTTNFTWSITTEPSGAEIWYSRLGEQEKKWAGVTNVTAQELEKAIWTFRIEWNGCSKIETPDPWIQAPINIQLAKTGCKKR